ncbi:MAG: cysteine dioxygenase family protein [Deltaproteobacteria bacterium]|nr:cysteine dioxygenase family protein [Deltaproteobacteria bacterium]
MQKDFEIFCHRFQELTEKNEDISVTLEKGIPIVQELISSDLWFRDFVKEALIERSWLKQQQPTLWPNELTLYRSPDQSFLVLAYIWEPFSVDTIHDHGSWGIVASFINDIKEVKFRRRDDGAMAGYAELEEAVAKVLKPGEITCVLPLNAGIHQMENISGEIAVTLNVYGRTVRRGYLQFFDRERKTVKRVYPPRTYKEVLMVRTIGAMGSGEDILKGALVNTLPDYVKEEYETAITASKRRAP